jgi:hypothetical protein
VSTYAVFDYATGKNLGEGETEDDAVLAACETLATAGDRGGWRMARLREYARGDQIDSAVSIHPQWQGSHLTGQS